MSCEYYEDRLWEAAETGKVPPDLGEHLAGCPACRQAYYSAAAALGGLAGLRAVNAPDPRAAIAGRLALRQGGFTFRLALAGGLAACLLAAALLVWFRLGLHGSEQEVRQHPTAPKQQVRAPENPVSDISVPKTPSIMRELPKPEPKRPRIVAHRVHRRHPIAVNRPKPSPPIVVSELETPCVQTTTLAATMLPETRMDYPEVSPRVGDPTYCAQPEPVRVSVKVGSAGVF